MSSKAPSRPVARKAAKKAAGKPAKKVAGKGKKVVVGRSARPAKEMRRAASAAAARAPAAAKAAPPDQREVEQFLFLEARLLDERRFEEWRELFTEDGVYWMPSQHGQPNADEVVSIFYDDRAVMASRIRRLRHPDAHIQIPHSHTAHLVGNVEVEAAPDADGSIVVHAVFFMAEYRREEPRWLSGRYLYRLQPTPGGLRIRMKKVMLVNCEAALPAMAVYA